MAICRVAGVKLLAGRAGFLLALGTSASDFVYLQDGE